jgi:hypothetical protein
MSKIEKLELRHLVGYLPYGIKGLLSRKGRLNQDDDYPNHRVHEIGIIKNISFWDSEITGQLHVSETYSFDFSEIDEVDILLRPLSDLTKEIEHNGERFVPADIICPKIEYKTEFDRQVAIGSLQLQGSIGFSCTYFVIVQKLTSWHFDLFGLIDSGLAVDINTVKV